MLDADFWLSFLTVVSIVVGTCVTIVVAARWLRDTPDTPNNPVHPSEPAPRPVREE